MLPKLEEETETVSGRRHRPRWGTPLHAGVGARAVRLGWEPGPAPLSPKVEGTRRGKQVTHAAVDENRRRFIQLHNPASWGYSHFSNRKYMHVWA